MKNIKVYSEKENCNIYDYVTYSYHNTHSLICHTT